MIDEAFWNSVKENDYGVPDGHSVAELTLVLLDYLASTDGNLRDGIGYEVLAQWIVFKPQYDADELRAMRDRLLDNLNEGLGKKNDDSVFLRSFSMLVLGLIVYRDNQEPFLAEDEIVALLHKSLSYLAAEQDVRGYVDNKGWAHAIAHTADTLKFLARNRHTDAAAHRRILNGVMDKLTAPVGAVYVFDEDERLAFPVLDVLKRDQLTAETLLAWAERFETWRKQGESTKHFDPNHFSTFHNLKNFLRSLYFQLVKLGRENDKIARLTDRVLEIVQQYNL
jgi:hypothetical protein